jgi:hypothetical protein
MCALVALGLVSSAALASVAIRYAGKTTQRAPVSFMLSGGYVRTLRFTIYIKCPSRHVWRIAASKFPPIKVQHGKFAQKFVARGSKGSATVKGQVARRRVRGTLLDRTFEPKEHHFCSGTARFDLVPPRQPQG